MKRTLFLALLLVIAVTWVNVAPSGVSAAAMKSLAGCGTNTLFGNDDESTGQVTLPFTPNFFGTPYSTLYVNNNGNVTFDTSLASFTPFDLTSTSRVIIAPFFGDVDTRAGASMTYGSVSFGGRPAFCVNWNGVGYYDRNTDKLNKFQLLLVDRSDAGPGDFDIIFNYDQIQWETGDASGGADGLGGDSARVGYSNGVDTALELPGSAIDGAFLDGSASGLVHNSRNSTIAGRFIFNVRNGVAPTGGSISGQVTGVEPIGAGVAGVALPLEGAPVQACFTQEPVPPCQLTSTNSDGQYVFTGLPGNGNYFVTAFPPVGSMLGPRTIGALFLAEGGSLTDQNIMLLASVPAPPNVTIDTPFTANDGTPAISSTTGASFTQTDSCPGGIATWSITSGGMPVASGSMTEGPSGTYTGFVPPLFPFRGRADMKISIDCPSPPDKNVTFDIYIDPSGNVLNSVNDAPVEGATVTLYRSDSAAGPFEVVPDGSAIMSPSNRTNPDITDAEGFFRWDVVAGYYVVRAQKAGCVSPDDAGQPYQETEVLQIPPPALDLIIYLNCGGGPVPTATNTPVGPPATATNTPVGPTATPTRTPTSTPSLFGDVNCDGVVNSIDAALILQFVAGLVNSLGCQDEADVNEDGNVNSIDAAIVLQYIAGFVPSLPV
ncbi:MAG: nidogen-like domain-containing protein [Dehalococcoidia bacterium]